MKAALKRIAILIVGWAFILLGIVGLFLPVLQGVLFLLIGLIVLSAEYEWAHRLLNRLRQRFPKLGKVADDASRRAQGWLWRIGGNRPHD